MERGPDSIARRLRWALVALTGVLVVGTVGYRTLGFSILDALYQTVTTVSTVGFREVEVLDARGKVFTIVLILVGAGTVLSTLALALEFVIAGQLRDLLGRRRMDRTVARMSGHIVLVGYGRVGRAFAAQEHRRDIVVVDLEPGRAVAAGYAVVQGDATNDDVLRAAGVERASALVAALNTDAANLFVTLTGRALNPNLFIVARARAEESVAKLHRAGADRVVNPQEIGGARMSAFIEQPNVAQFLDVVVHEHSLDLRLHEIVLHAQSPMVGRTLRELQVRDTTGALVLAVGDGSGKFTPNPAADVPLHVGEVVIAIGTEQQLDRLTQLAG